MNKYQKQQLQDLRDEVERLLESITGWKNIIDACRKTIARNETAIETAETVIKGYRAAIEAIEAGE